MPPGNLNEKSNNHPYIIACGDTIDNITHYYIELEKHLMSVSCGNILPINTIEFKNIFQNFMSKYCFFFSKVPKEYSFAETFDL